MKGARFAKTEWFLDLLDTLDEFQTFNYQFTDDDYETGEEAFNRFMLDDRQGYYPNSNGWWRRPLSSGRPVR